jgi:hypothetical protein
MFDRLLSALYRWLHNVGEWREHHEVFITLVETSAALLGALLFLGVLPYVGLFDREFYELITGPLECIILVFLAVSLLARAALLLRHLWRGPDFWELAKRKTLLADLAALRAGRAFFGHRLGGKPQRVREVIGALARVSASTYSMRTLREPDKWWEYWEAAYVSEWHALCPDAIWRAPAACGGKAGKAGFYSVLIPITNQSCSRYRRGHLHAALATPEIGRRRRPARPDRDAYVNLLAYSAIYVAADPSDKNWDLERLLYTPLEHLSALIARRWPDLLQDGPVRGLRVVCESSNTSLDRVLERLGFHALYPEQDDPEESGERQRRPKPLKSPAGFKLYELSYHPSIATEDPENAKGLLFLDALRRIACRPPPPVRHGPAEPPEAPAALA